MLTLMCAALTPLPWLAFLRARVDGLAAVAVAALGVPALVAFVMLTPRVPGASVTAMVLGALALSGATGLGLWLRDRHFGRNHTSPLPHLLVPAGAGAMIALATFVVARFAPGSPRVSWAMLGDSASQLVGTRQVLADGSLRGAPLLSSVPLPPAIIGAVAAPGRDHADPAGLLSHDLTAYATTWAALIVMMCVLAGIIG